MISRRVTMVSKMTSKGRTVVGRERFRSVRKLSGRILGTRAPRHDPEAGR